MFANRDTGVPVRRASAAASGSGSVGLQDEDSEQEELPQSKGKRRNRKSAARGSSKSVYEPVVYQIVPTYPTQCDRRSPCSACIERGEGDSCEWEGAIRLPPSNYSRDQESAELREQLDRLENLLTVLDSTPGQVGDDESGVEGMRRYDLSHSIPDGEPRRDQERLDGDSLPGSSPNPFSGFAHGDVKTVWGNLSPADKGLFLATIFGFESEGARVHTGYPPANPGAASGGVGATGSARGVGKRSMDAGGPAAKRSRTGDLRDEAIKLEDGPSSRLPPVQRPTYTYDEYGDESERRITIGMVERTVIINIREVIEAVVPEY